MYDGLPKLKTLEPDTPTSGGQIIAAREALQPAIDAGVSVLTIYVAQVPFMADGTGRMMTVHQSTDINECLTILRDNPQYKDIPNKRIAVYYRTDAHVLDVEL